MSFVSTTWLLWLLGVTAAYRTAPARWKAATLAGASVAFLAIHAPWALVALCGLTLACWLPFRERARIPGHRALAVVAGLVTVFAALRLAERMGEAELASLEGIALPLGFAYAAVRALHYVLERYKGTLPPHGPAELAGYFLFFPTLIVGPIHRFPAYLKDARRQRCDDAMLLEGLERILIGYLQVVVVAGFVFDHHLGAAIDRLAAEHPRAGAYAAMVAYAFELYFLFAGYSDVAIGFARTLGFRVMENFDRPFLKANISDFWRSWHISLTGFVRDYVYTGVVAVSRRPALAAIAAMLAMGLWHEASPRYLLWGVYHGLGIALWQAWRAHLAPRLPEAGHPALAMAGRAAATLATFHFVALGFYFVSGTDFADGVARLTALVRT